MTYLLSMLLSCADAAWILQGIRQSEIMSPTIRAELTLEVLRGTEPSCDIERELSKGKPRG